MENPNIYPSQLASNQDIKEAVYRLLNYAVSDANLDVDDQLINDVVPVLQKDTNEFTPADSKTLWFGYNSLSQLVFPATNESLWLKEHMERDDRARAENNAADYSPVAKAYKKSYASFKWVGYIAALIFFLLQSYTVILFDSLKQVDQHYLELVKIDELMLAAKQANPAIEACSSPLKELGAQEEQLLLKIDTHYRVMHKLSNAFWGYFYSSETLNYYLDKPAQCQPKKTSLLPNFESSEPSFNQDQQARAERATFFEGAKSMLRLCNYLVLPLVLGTLGSVAYVIRSILDSFARASLTFGSHRRGSMRVYLGALLGLISGIIIAPDIKEIQELSYSPLLWAFLMGYSVEFAFTFFDSLIARGRNALQVIKEPTSAAKEDASEDEKAPAKT